MNKVVLLTILAAMLLVGLVGCSPQEKAGVSPLPQNRPAEWELRPYSMPRTYFPVFFSPPFAFSPTRTYIKTFLRGV